MLRVLHFGPQSSTIGGMQTVLRTIQERSIGADQVLLIPTWSGKSQPRNAVLVMHALRALASSPSRTVAHIHMSTRGAWLREGSVIAAAHSLRLPTVVSLHGDDFPVFAASRPNFVRAVLSKADYVTCLSSEAHGMLSHVGVRVHSSVLRNPVEIDFEAPPVSKTEPIVVFAGEVGRRKGVDVLAAAWETIVRSGIQATCRVIGPIRDYRPPSLPRFYLEGPAQPHVVRQAIRDSRVVTLPSRSEGMPMVLAEAVAAGRPFVATGVGGTRDLAPSDQMIIPVDDPDALAAALTRFLVDVERATVIGGQARELCKATRSPEIIDRELRSIYQTLFRDER